MLIAKPAILRKQSRKVQTAAGARWYWRELFPQNEKLADVLATKGIFAMEELTLIHRDIVFRTNVVSPRHAVWMDTLLEAHGLAYLDPDHSAPTALAAYYGGKSGVPLRLLPYATPGIGDRGARIIASFKLFGALSISDLAKSSESEFRTFADVVDTNPWRFNATHIDARDKVAILQLMSAFKIRFRDAG